MHTLLVGIAGSGKTRHCVARGLEALESGRELVYLVPNREEALQVRRRLLVAGGREAVFLPQIQRFADLAGRVLDAAGERVESRDRLTRHLHLSRLLAERADRLGELAESAATPGFQEILDRFFREMAEGDLSPDDLRLLESQRAVGLADLYETFLARQVEDGRLDAPRLLARAAERLEAEPALLGGLELLIIDGFSNLSPLQLRFLEALLPGTRETILSLCLDPTDLDADARAPFEGLTRLARRFHGREGWSTEKLAAPHRYEGAFLPAVAGGLFRQPAGEQGDAEAAGSVVLYEAATPRDEAEGVLRELRHLLADGLRPEQIAVLFRDPAYEGLLSDVLAEAGVPFQMETRRALSRSRPAALVLDLLDAILGSPVPDLPQRLRGEFVGTADATLAALQAEARARGVPGAKPWKDFLGESRASRPDENWDWMDAFDAPPEGKLTGSEWLETALLPLLELLEGNLARNLRDGILQNAPGLWRQAADGRVWEALAAAGGGIAREAEAPGARLGASAWLRHLRRAVEIAELSERRGVEGGGVLLGNPFESRLPELDTVFLCGLSQGGFPPPFREHPLLRESERQALNRRLEALGRAARLPLWPDRQADERYLFYVAATRASRRLILSWPLRDLRGRLRPRSSFLEELGRIGPLPDPLPLPPRSLPGKLADPVRIEDLARDTLLARRRRERHPLADAAREFIAGSERFADELDRKERGTEQSLSGNPALAAHLEDYSHFSASSLEAYAGCPYRFLMQKVLGLAEEDDYEPGALEEGRLYHKTLELFYSRWDGSRPSPEDLAALYARAVDVLADKDGMASLRSPRFRAEDPRRLRILARFLEKDLDRIEQSGYRPDPAGLEKSFTLASADLRGEEAADPFELRGYVDRVDGSESGPSLIIDYKRSERDAEDPTLERPRNFQLALYAMGWHEPVGGAAYAAMKVKKPLRGYFRADLKKSLSPWTVRGDKGGHWLSDVEWEAWLERVAARIRGIVAEIREGRLNARPVNEDACKYCDFAQVCRWRDDHPSPKGGGARGA